MPDETPSRIARRLMRQSGRASLGTSMADGVGPYVSLVLVACDQDISPLLLISNLAQHTQNLMANPNAGLLFDGTADLANPLTGARISVLGAAEPVDDDRALDRFVRRQPSAAGYRDFGDFRLWRFTPTRGQLVAGFGKIAWIEADALRPDAAIASALAAAEADILARLNADHAPLIEALAGGAGWRLTGVDPDGADLRCEDQTARLDFAAPAVDADGVLAQLKALKA